ncbi:SAM-dependent methyltransferase [Spirosoma endophyticum]|nr:methyltransferase domain-containing protein [Spirosoma endophyticum]
MHYGYWESDTKRLRDALFNINKKVAQLGQIKEGQRLIDLGCGVGGPAVYLAKNYNCEVSGISLSLMQIEQARHLARKENLNFIDFRVQDYCNTDFKNDEFHIAYAIESSCYAVDKTFFLEEAKRILKPDGKIIVIDFFWSTDKTNDADKKIMKKWTDSWSILDFSYERDFENQLESAGFFNIKKYNCNKQVWPSIRRLFLCFLIGFLCDALLRLVGKRNKLNSMNMRSAYYQYVTFEKGLWNYNIYCAEKP